jgi:hypothetical protein
MPDGATLNLIFVLLTATRVLGMALGACVSPALRPLQASGERSLRRAAAAAPASMR